MLQLLGITPSVNLILGFFTTDESQGNYGIDDIRLSLEWLTVNARSIGVSNNFILLAEGNAAGIVHWAVNDYPQGRLQTVEDLLLVNGMRFGVAHLSGSDLTWHAQNQLKREYR